MSDIDLVEWAKGERESAQRQLALFGEQGVKAQLIMPDGSTQDITAGVLEHQQKNVANFTRLITALETPPGQ